MLLLATDRPSFGKDLTARLEAAGVYLFRVPLETALFYAHKKDTGGAILDGALELQKAEALCKSLKEAYPELPVALLLTPKGTPDAPADRLIRETSPDAVFDEALEFAVKICGFRTSPLSTFHLYVGNDRSDVLYKGYRLPLSQKEYELLRILFYRAPNWTSADDLMELLYPDGSRKISTLFAHISHINKKVKACGEPPLILCRKGLGYRLCDTVLL
ncbi:MAG: winged helix-turn-helix domain-containing protein [Clostridia bacterium]|nr:winged helix-turn-helix domain-containing protein [Clostridia bacterium]